MPSVAMGMHIHFDWNVDTDLSRARNIVRLLHESALRLPFDEVTEVWEDVWDAKDPKQDIQGRRPRWYFRNPFTKKDTFEDTFLRVVATRSIQFYVNNNGGETSTYGLAQFPATCEVQTEQGVRVAETDIRNLWAWHCSCKTQYAGHPTRGGFPNLLRVHGGIVSMCDRAIELGVNVDVRDEGGYWKTRDSDVLRQNLEEHNKIVAKVAGAFSDALAKHDSSLEVRAPIKSDPNFERYEALGPKALRKQKRSDDERPQD